MGMLDPLQDQYTQPDAGAALDTPILPKGRQLLDLIHVRATQGDPLALTLLEAHRASLTAEERSLEAHLHLQPHVRRGYARELRDVHLAQAFLALDDNQSRWRRCIQLAAMMQRPLQVGTPLWKAEQQRVGMPGTPQGIQNIVVTQLSFED